MVNKVTQFYTTDEPYRAVGSNHLSKIKYDSNSLTLWITFANGALYEYYGVPERLYRGLMRSPSHGVYFWENIRQRYPFELVPNISSKVAPEQAKLDSLDENEKGLDKQLRKGLITLDKHTSLLNVINTKRERLIKKLEKDGYFSEELEEELQEPEEKQRFASVLFMGLGAGLVWCFKVTLLAFVLFFGLLGSLMR